MILMDAANRIENDISALRKSLEEEFKKPLAYWNESWTARQTTFQII
jgi:hypothetical protein